MDHNLLTINAEKTTFIPFASYKNHLPKYANLSFHGQQCSFEETCHCGLIIKKSEIFKYLGITLDCNLKWEPHITGLIKKIRSFLYIFKQLRYILPTKSLVQVYKALVESQLSYGILGWGGVLKNNLRKLDVTQKLIIKIMFFKKTLYSSDLLYTEAQLMDIRQLFAIRTLCNLNKDKNSILTQEQKHTYSTRNKELLIYNVPVYRKSQGTRSYHFLAIKIYNALPYNIKIQTQQYKYMKLLRLWVINSRWKIDNILE